jgi:hypothetical protein
MAVDRIADVVDANMDRMYGLLDDFIYSKSLAGRFETFCQACNAASMKVASGVVAAAKLPGRAARAVSNKVMNAIEELEAEENTYDNENEEYEL